MVTPVRARELRFLTPALLAQLGTLELKARTVVEGFLSGLHRSPYRGFSVEFAEYRQYMPGDDLASIDWKVYARSDRHYVKKFEEDTNVECHLLVDVSASMGYASGEVSKLQYAQVLAASLAYLMSRQRDAVALAAFDERVVSHLPPSARPGHLHALLVALDRLTPGRRTDAAAPLNLLARQLARRGVVVLISDLLDEPSRVVEALRHFRFRGSDVIVFHVLDRAELTFPFERPTRFRDIEGTEEVVAAPADVRDAYLAALRETTAVYRRELGAAGIAYVQLDTAEPLEFALLAYLSSRSRVR